MKNLRHLTAELYRELLFGGRFLRRGAAEVLAQDGSPEAVRLFAEAAIWCTDVHVRQIALQSLLA